VERRLAADLEAVKIEPELDPIPDAIGQPPFVPRTEQPNDSQACKYGDPICKAVVL
jgi:hypothetical protein